MNHRCSNRQDTCVDLAATLASCCCQDTHHRLSLSRATVIPGDRGGPKCQQGMADPGKAPSCQHLQLPAACRQSWTQKWPPPPMWGETASRTPGLTMMRGNSCNPYSLICLLWSWLWTEQFKKPFRTGYLYPIVILEQEFLIFSHSTLDHSKVLLFF